MQIVAQAPAAAAITVASGAAFTASAVIPGEPGAGTQCNLNLPGSNRLNGQPFTVRAAGYMTCPAGTYTSAATPISFVLFAANTASFVAASGNAIFTSTAVATFTISSAVPISAPWTIEAECIADSVSGTLLGAAQAIVPSTPNLVTSVATARAAITQAPTVHTVNMSNEPPLQFAVGVQTAASNLLLATTVQVTSFVLEQ